MNKRTTSTVRALALLGVVGAGVVISASAQAGGNALGAMGDSLTDEYFEESYSYAQNWVQQLAVYRDIDVGPTAADAGQPGGTWGEPRRTGYEYNWARSGATSASLLADGQHTGLAAQIAPNGITYAVLAIGANDFIPILGPTGEALFTFVDFGGAIYPGAMDDYFNGSVDFTLPQDGTYFFFIRGAPWIAPLNPAPASSPATAYTTRRRPRRRPKFSNRCASAASRLSGCRSPISTEFLGARPSWPTSSPRCCATGGA